MRRRSRRTVRRNKPDVRRCGALTKSGTGCRRRSQHKFGFCPQHGLAFRKQIGLRPGKRFAIRRKAKYLAGQQEIVRALGGRWQQGVIIKIYDDWKGLRPLYEIDDFNPAIPMINVEEKDIRSIDDLSFKNENL